MHILEIWRGSPAFYLSSIFVLGLLVGSFLNVVILRLPVMLKRRWRSECEGFLAEEQPLASNSAAVDAPFNLVTPRSRCPHCGHAISAWENIPVISYMALGGKCRSCKTPISMRYPIIELLSAVLVTLTAWRFGVSIEALGAILLTWVLLALTFIDLDHQILPDDITLPFLWLGLIFNLGERYTDLQSAVIGAIAGYLVLWLVYQAFKKITGKEGMGYGDFKLLALFGAWLGWQFLPVIILISSFIGAVIGIGLIVFRGHDRTLPIPFGPYLAIAGWIALLWGNDLIRLYFDFVGLSV